MVASTTHVLNAQNIPSTIREAETQGADIAHEGPQVAEQSYVHDSPFGGTADRRCVPTAEQNWAGSLRSGDFIVRGRLNDDASGFQAGKEHKVLWIPVHGSASWTPPLVVRAARVGNPADSVHFNIEHLVHGGGGPTPLYGYQSLVSFPSAGQWVVVATAGNDWGCFLFDVASHRS
jgi:hypothetical protein